MKNAKRNMMMTLSLLMTSSLLISCTKEIPYKEVFKEKVHAKAEIDTAAEYLYVASSDTASSDDLGAANAMPYWQGQEKIIRFRFTENNLQALEVTEEGRLKDNSLNEKVVLEIPISHVEYRCAEDRYQKCTNREEENYEINWSKKSKFIPQFDRLKMVGASLLPVEMDKIFGGSCYTESASRFLNYELTKDSLNIQIEKSFTANLGCLAEMGANVSSLNDLQTQIVYHYSFAKLKTLSSPKYQAVAYPRSDEGTFGFFTTEFNHYDVDYNRTEKGRTVFMNRWNPARKDITYYLSDNFNKPEMASMKKATEVAFERVNQGLQDAGIETRLVLKDAAHKQPGDIRNSMIVMVEDPIAAGPLGYGPTVTNPRTGEILSGRVVMYHGNMLQNIKYTYDEVLRELRAAKLAAAQRAPEQKPDPAVGASAEDLFSKSLNHSVKTASYLKAAMSDKVGQKIAKSYKAGKSSVMKSNKAMALEKMSLEQIKGLSKTSFHKELLQIDKSSSLEDRLSAMSRHCNYPAELFPFDEAVKNGLQSKLGEDLKPWEQLSADEKQEVIALIGPEIWVPTLIHELGHNLGLRHNFAGSEDKDNFYSKEELAKMSVKHAVPYSSVMDYGYSELNLLPTLGKYDIAALRFAYKREVESKAGETIKLQGSLAELVAKSGDTLKSYSFCTDDHVSANPNCNRFDKGTTLSEMADHFISQYDALYNLRNFRNGRESFSQMSDPGYAAARKSGFNQLRAFMERYESLKYTFRLNDNAKEWNTIPFLADLKEAALKSGRFLVDVLTTPDLTCAVVSTSNPNQIVGFMPLDQLSPQAMDCFGATLNPAFKVVGQFGKSFNHRKDPNSDNNYADQIDVRGIYLDKMMAAETLFQRRTGNSIFDRYQDNYLDMPELAPLISNTVTALLMNQVKRQVEIKDQNGNVIARSEVPLSMFTSPDTNKAAGASHWIQPALTPSIAKALGLPMQAVSFQQVLLNTMEKNLSSVEHWEQDRRFMDAFRVVKTNKTAQINDKISRITRDEGSLRLIALEENQLAQLSLLSTTAMERLAQLTPQQLDAVLADKMALHQALVSGQSTSAVSVDMPPEIREIPLEIVVAFKNQALDYDMLRYLATILPEAK